MGTPGRGEWNVVVGSCAGFQEANKDLKAEEEERQGTRIVGENKSCGIAEVSQNNPTANMCCNQS